MCSSLRKTPTISPYMVISVIKVVDPQTFEGVINVVKTKVSGSIPK